MPRSLIPCYPEIRTGRDARLLLPPGREGAPVRRVTRRARPGAQLALRSRGGRLRPGQCPPPAEGGRAAWRWAPRVRAVAAGRECPVSSPSARLTGSTGGLCPRYQRRGAGLRGARRRRTCRGGDGARPVSSCGRRAALTTQWRPELARLQPGCEARLLAEPTARREGSGCGTMGLLSLALGPEAASLPLRLPEFSSKGCCNVQRS